MIVACLDTILNLPLIVISIVTGILQGKDTTLNQPYISWKNVHDNGGGNLPGLSLSSILQKPASVWSTDSWTVFIVKWNEWFCVLHAVIFFSLFGTTPEMRRYYRTAFWFIPERFGYKGRRGSEVQTVSDIAFDSDPGQQTGSRFTAKSRRGSLSFLEAAIDKGATHSRVTPEGNNLESGMTTAAAPYVIETVAFVEGDEYHATGHR